MEIFYQISWKQNYLYHICDSSDVANGSLQSGSDAIKCQYGCSGTIISPMSFVCTFFSIKDDWLFGEHHITHIFNNVSDENTITIGTVSFSWIREISTYTGYWNISTTFSLVPRADTGKINSSPQVSPIPSLLLQQGCKYTISLPVSDPDNDTIRCRWAVGSECKAICNKFPGAVLDSASCTITYIANKGTGLKAVAIMIEDYAPVSLNHPLSSVALQFLVLVFDSSQVCSKQTECFRFLSITLHPSNKIVLLSGESVNLKLTCMANETSSYYWEKQNGNIPSNSIGAHTNALTLINVQPEDAGNYRCVAFVCNVINPTLSNYATITVNGKLLCT